MTDARLKSPATARHREPILEVLTGVVTAEAKRQGLARERVVEMPANNLSVIFRKGA